MSDPDLFHERRGRRNEADGVRFAGREDHPKPHRNRERVRLRIDFNATLTGEQFERAGKWLPRDRAGLRLALDCGVASDGVDVLVAKPAAQEMPKTPLEIVVTSSMDHALGQIAAAWVAASHRADGPRLVPPEGMGFDFDDLLEKIPWQKPA